MGIMRTGIELENEYLCQSSAASFIKSNEALNAYV